MVFSPPFLWVRRRRMRGAAFPSFLGGSRFRWARGAGRGAGGVRGRVHVATDRQGEVPIGPLDSVLWAGSDGPDGERWTRRGGGGVREGILASVGPCVWCFLAKAGVDLVHRLREG